MTLFSEVSENYGLAWGYNQLGEMTRLVGDYSRAQMAYENSLQICRQIGNKRREAIALLNLAYVALYLKDYAQANSYVVQGLGLLQELNLKYLGRDEPTDVIAFPMLAQPPAEELPPFVRPPDGVAHLGEVIISYPQAVIQAEEHRQSVKRELALLIIHGILHLLGYDHEDPTPERRMRAREAEILAGIRELD